MYPLHRSPIGVGFGAERVLLELEYSPEVHIKSTKMLSLASKIKSTMFNYCYTNYEHLNIYNKQHVCLSTSKPRKQVQYCLYNLTRSHGKKRWEW